MLELKFVNLATLHPLKISAVLLPLFIKNGEASLLFTKRTENVTHHKGQICFPGGVREEKDDSLWQTALRETEEEIGIGATKISLIGQLTELVTPTQYHITPFLGLVSDVSELTPNHQEIAEIFHAPLDHFLDPQNIKIEKRTYFGETFEMPAYDFGGHHIWGATGKMVHNLVVFIQNRSFTNYPDVLAKTLTKFSPAI